MMRKEISKEVDEKSLLLEKQSMHSKSSLSCWETGLSFFPRLPRPISYLFESGTERDFKDKIAKGTILEIPTQEYNSDRGVWETVVKREPIIVEGRSIAFRADTRHPDEIFTHGMNVYSVKRQLYRTLTDYSCCIPAWTCFLPISLLCCLASYFPNSASESGFALYSPGDWFGQNQYRSLYATGWGALAFSKDYHNANTYMSDNASYWKYITYFPDGYVDFGTYCRYLRYNGIKRSPEEEFDDGDGHFQYHGPCDVAEIIPKGLQQVNAENILAAVHKITGEVMINKNSVFYREGLENEIKTVISSYDRSKNISEVLLQLIQLKENDMSLKGIRNGS